MKRLVRAWLMAAAMACSLAAHAQRQPVPVMNFEAIPVSLSTTKRPSADQVRAAFVAAGLATQWELVPTKPGVFEATYRKGNKHTVVAEVSYDAEAYSVRYVSSVNMKYSPEARWGSNNDDRYGNRGGVSSVADSAAKKQQELFAGLPESAYGKPDPKAVIHPFYERWVHELLDGVRARLKAIE